MKPRLTQPRGQSPLLNSEKKKYQFLYAVLGLTAVTGVAWGVFLSDARGTAEDRKEIRTKDLKKALTRAIKPAVQAGTMALPTELTLKSDRAGASVQGSDRVVVQYTIDSDLQQTMEKLYRQYRPDYGAFAAVDPDTGAVLAMVSHSNDPKLRDNLAIRATFPSASIFKVVTAAAALSKTSLEPHSVIPFTGSNHTLYKSHVLKPAEPSRWVRHMTLSDAFARSVNTIFGRIGAHKLGAGPLREFADRFGFDQDLGADFPLGVGRAEIQNDAWELAEAASGYTKDNTMSPVHGALIAAAVVNGGRLMEPHLIASAYLPDGTPIYEATPTPVRQSIDAATAGELKELMRATITKGTSRKSFRGFAKGIFRSTDVGGKTGSLTGDNPKGKVDWFVGFAEHRGRRIAVAALTVNEKLWRVKSSWLARRSMETYIKSRLEQASSR